MDRSSGSRWLLIGNLGCEEEWAAGAGRGARPRTLSAPARATAAIAGTLLRALAGPDDLLWTVEPVDPGRLVPAPGLPIPRLVSGSLRRVSAGGAGGGGVLAWGETAAVGALRERWCGARTREPEGGGSRSGGLPGLAGALRVLPRSKPEIAARANDRSFALDVARREGWALPGACTVASIDELERRVRSLEHEGPGAGAWVAKAPLSAAGRHRLIARSADEVGRPEVRRHASGLLERYGSLVLEPWLPRIADFGCAALVAPEGVRPISWHRLEVDRRGAFSGLELGPSDGPPPSMSRREWEVMERAVGVVGGALAGLGYRGPFGIDSFRWRGADGEHRFHPLCEVNARMTFGLVARVLAERVLEAGDGAGPAGARTAGVALRFGRSIPGRDDGPVPDGRIVPLVTAAGGEGGAGPVAWLRIAPPGATSGAVSP